MVTISIDYDSNGDVELILEKKDNTPLNQAAQQASQSSEQQEPVKYKVTSPNGGCGSIVSGGA